MACGKNNIMLDSQPGLVKRSEKLRRCAVVKQNESGGKMLVSMEMQSQFWRGF